MKKFDLKKYLFSPTLTIAFVCFLLAGISFFAPQQKNTSPLTSKQTIIAKPSPVLGSATTIAPTEIIVTSIVYPTIAPIPTQTTTTSTTASTQSSNPQVSMTVSEPDGTNNFTVDFHTGMNACDTLSEAKTEGKIKSVTMQWYASLNSNYVYEINGYKNNWTFTVDGKSPQGCSLITLKQNDNVVWKYE